MITLSETLNFRNLIDGVQKTAARTPKAIAITETSTSVVLTYGELLQRASGLAEGLAERGIGKGSLVGIYLQRSPEMIVAILGVLMSGAAYLPLDVDMPLHRLNYILEDSKPAIFLSSEVRHLARALGSHQNILDVNDWPREGTHHERSDDIAYVIYTSGSTGYPKGVAIHDSSLSNYLHWCVNSLTFNGGGVPIFSSAAYDLIITALFPPLIVGEPLHIIPQPSSQYTLADNLLTGTLYSYMKITPSHMRMLSIDERAALGCAVKTVVFGGETLHLELVTQIRRDSPDLRVINHYGPTEITVGCCTYEIPKNFDGSTIPIGRPIPGLECTIRDESGDEISAGCAGELYISGAGLALGYWHDPNLTSEKFITLPDSTGNMHRWYKSGDIASLRDDGELEFHGRIDDQLKILGHRVEPAEVERTLRAHELIADTCVIGLTHTWGSELIALVVADQHKVSEIELRQYLRSHLHSAMVPARLVFCDTLPLRENGKVDRARIIAQFSHMPASEGSIALKVLAKWREVLQEDSLRADDDFFEAGGDSVAAMELCFWAIEQFGINIEPSAIFTHPTVNTFIDLIQTTLNPQTGSVR